MDWLVSTPSCRKILNDQWIFWIGGIYSDKAYQDCYASTKELYRDNPQFRKDVENNSRQVLLTRIGIKSEVEAVLPVAEPL